MSSEILLSGEVSRKHLGDQRAYEVLGMQGVESGELHRKASSGPRNLRLVA